MDIKICGLTSREGIDWAIAAGADMIGLVSFARSPRHVDLDRMADLADHARGRARVVVLTVDAADDDLAAIAARVRPDSLQLHGHETIARAAAVRDATGIAVMKALGVGSAGDVAALGPWFEAGIPVLLDAKPPKDATRPGGLGRPFDWTLLAGLDPAARFMLSGGLDPANVGEAVRTLRPAGVDVSSGVEAAPGVKDEALIRTFVAAARAAERSGAGSRTGRGTGCARRRPPPMEGRDDVKPNSYRTGPDERGHFGTFGGRFVAETLMPLILDLEKAYEEAKADPAFHEEIRQLHTHYVGRPSPMYFAQRLTEHLGGAKIYFKRDELNHTGSHKINNCLGQILLAKRMGKTRIIAETGAGQHGVASATVCARFGFPCEVYMGATDVTRQAPNVFRMKLLGAKVHPVTAGNGTLKDAMNEALRDWVTNVEDTYYLIGTAAGPHPYPAMVRDFQSIIGTEARAQIQEMEGRLPDALVACVGGGSNAIGLFHPFLDDEDVAIYGVEAGGHGLDVYNGHAASLTGGKPGVLHGNRTYLLQDDDGQILEGHSISAGLDYPGIGPEHSWLKDSGRVTYVPATDAEAMEAFQLLTRLEGIIPALEPAHALAHVIRLAPTMGKDQIIVMNLCGRGDKDVFTVGKLLGFDM